MRCILFNRYNQSVLLIKEKRSYFTLGILRVTIVSALILLLLILCIPSFPVSADLGTDFIWVGIDVMDTSSIAWGDWDGDGDLDLAVGNFGEVNQVYENDNGIFYLAWESPDSRSTRSIAWGDWDGDGDLDLAMGNDGVNQLYENEDGTLKLDPINGLGWESPDSRGTHSIAWGDWDGDGDLDLAVGNFENEVNQVYENEDGTLKLDPINGLGWESPDSLDTSSIAWGDWDNDGDLDLAVGNGEFVPGFGCMTGDVNQVYENDGGTLILDLANGLGWKSPNKQCTVDVAWGDWDNDGDLDLAVGNGSGDLSQVFENSYGMLKLDPVNGFGWIAGDSYSSGVDWGDWDNDGDLDLATGAKVYENDEGTLDPYNGFGWDSGDNGSTVWGDYDGDGDLDLAVGKFGMGNVIYQNHGKVLTLDPIHNFGWTSTDDREDTQSIAWGDWDNDGDLDLAIGNDGINQVYSNENTRLVLAWSSTGDDKDSRSVAWGDWDSDGDLDLAVGNFGDVNQVYENEGGFLKLDPDNGFGWINEGETLNTTSVAWGDWDGDGDLDLAVGNAGDVNQVYENEAGTLKLETLNGLGWESTGDLKGTVSVAWGDWDGDGDLDLALGNNNEVNQVYNNTGRNFNLAWVSTGDKKRTTSVA